jgi:hypothetical protein
MEAVKACGTAFMINVRRDGRDANSTPGGIPRHSSETDLETIEDGFFNYQTILYEFKSAADWRYATWGDLRVLCRHLGLIEHVQGPVSDAEQAWLGPIKEMKEAAVVALFVGEARMDAARGLGQYRNIPRRPYVAA